MRPVAIPTEVRRYFAAGGPVKARRRCACGKWFSYIVGQAGRVGECPDCRLPWRHRATP